MYLPELISQKNVKHTAQNCGAKRKKENNNKYIFLSNQLFIDAFDH